MRYYRGNFSNFGQSFPWIGLGLVLFGVIIFLFPRILVAFIAVPVIMAGIVLLSKWFHNRKNNSYTYIEL
ncbi:MAG: hypothetical protein D6677_05255 [Calditrichaeota bacterium]|nr:MAG: hypothetical protein D6677_05255 [Calditrichota bacterium]